MINNGAHISRYLIQCVIQYRGRYAPHSFIKRQWSHSLSFGSFVHLLDVAVNRMGFKEVEWSKNSDDGAVFRQWLVDKKSHGGRARVEWETIQEMFQKYGFIPFCPKVSANACANLALHLHDAKRIHLSLTSPSHFPTNLACYRLLSQMDSELTSRYDTFSHDACHKETMHLICWFILVP